MIVARERSGFVLLARSWGQAYRSPMTTPLPSFASSGALRAPLGLSVPLLVLLSLSSSAAQADHYDPDAVAAASSVFRAVAEEAQTGLSAVEGSVSGTDGALADLDLGLALSLGAVDTRFHKLWRARLDERSTRFGTEFRAVQEAIYGFETASERAFSAALERSLAALVAENGGLPTECVASGGVLATLTGPGGPSDSKQTSCPGEDRSVELAGLWDQDQALQEAAAAIRAWEWPQITTYREAEPALALGQASVAEGWIAPADLVHQLPEVVEVLDTIEHRANKARAALIEARNALDPEAEGAEERVAAIRDRAKGIRHYLTSMRKALGVELWAAVDRARKKGKKRGWSEVGLCPNPPAWGGCEGLDRTDAVAEVALSDKKLQKKAVALLESLGHPETSLP